MPLDQATAVKLWNSRYKSELEATARKNAYLDASGMSDVDNLFGDLTVNVFLKAVNSFNSDKVTFTDDTARSFNSFFETIKGQYLANLAAHRDDGKQTYFRQNQRSLDQPMKSGDDESEGASLLDIISDATNDASQHLELQDLMDKLPDKLAAPLSYIVENVDAGDVSKVWAEVRKQFGFTPTRLLNALSDQPAFVDFVTA